MTIASRKRSSSPPGKDIGKSKEHCRDLGASISMKVNNEHYPAYKGSLEKAVHWECAHMYLDSSFLAPLLLRSLAKEVVGIRSFIHLFVHPPVY